MKLSLILGHRGARFRAPENSLESFKNAIKCGADGVELDVHLTKDGKLVVIHDSDLRRITGEKTFIKSLTLSEIRLLDISRLIKSGSFSVQWNIKIFRLSDNKFTVEIHDEIAHRISRYFVEKSGDSVKSIKKLRLPGKPGGNLVAEEYFAYESSDIKPCFKTVRIPELGGVLENVGANFVNIEIKRGEGFYPGISEKIVKTIEPYGFENFLISSFNRKTLLYIKKQYPFLKVNYLYEIPKNPVKAAKDLDGVNPFSLLIGKKGISHLHNIGKTVFPWVVNKPISIAKFILFGADGIITDRPCFAVSLKKEIKKLFDETIK